MRRVIDAAVGEGHVGRGQLHRRYAVGERAQRQRQSPVAVGEGDADLFKIGAACSYADLVQHGDGGDVHAPFERFTDSDVAVVIVAGVSRRVAAGKGGGCVVKDGGGRGAAIFNGRRKHGQGL